MKHLFLLSGVAAALSFTGMAHAADDKAPSTESAAIDISSNLKGKTFTLSDGKYAPSKINDNIDHYVVYYTASW